MPVVSSNNSDPGQAKKHIRQLNLKSLCEHAARTPHGAFVEIGVYRGVSAMSLSEVARAQDRGPIYLYDTFQGIPYADPELDQECPVGRFSATSVECVKQSVPDSVIIKGVFPESLIPMPPVAFVHADADQYRSTRAICEVMPRFMVPGGIIYFDDWALKGCRQAVIECFGMDRITVIPRRRKAFVVFA